MSVTLAPNRTLPVPRSIQTAPLPPIAVPDDAFCSSIPEAIKWRLIGWLGSTLRLDRFPAKRLGASPVILQLGAGQDTPPHVVNADFFHIPLLMKRPKPDWAMDLTRPFRCPDRCIDGIFTQHTLEHLTPQQVLNTLRECRRVLRPGSRIRVVVPDAEKYVMAVNGLRPLPDHGRAYALPIEGLRAVAQDFGHRSLWSPELMRRYLLHAGFHDARIESFGHGGDPRLLLDTEIRRDESLYAEAVA